MPTKVSLIVMIYYVNYVQSLHPGWQKVPTNFSFAELQVQDFNVTDCRSYKFNTVRYPNPLPTCGQFSEVKNNKVPLKVDIYEPLLSPITIRGQLCKKKEYETTTFEHFWGTKTIKSHFEKFVSISAHECRNIGTLSTELHTKLAGFDQHGTHVPIYHWMVSETTKSYISFNTSLEATVDLNSKKLVMADGLEEHCSYTDGQCVLGTHGVFLWEVKNSTAKEIMCPMKFKATYICSATNSANYLIINCAEQKIQLIFGDGLDLKNNLYCNIYKSNNGILTKFSLSNAHFHDDADVDPLDHTARSIMSRYTLNRLECTNQEGETQCAVSSGRILSCNSCSLKDVPDGHCLQLYPNITLCKLPYELECGPIADNETISSVTIDYAHFNSLDPRTYIPKLPTNQSICMNVAQNKVKVYENGFFRARKSVTSTILSYISHNLLIHGGHYYKGYQQKFGEKCHSEYGKSRFILGHNYKEVIDNLINTEFSVVCEFDTSYSSGTYAVTNSIKVENQYSFVYKKIEFETRTTGLATSFATSEMSYLYKVLNEFENQDHEKVTLEQCYMKQSEYLTDKLLEKLFPARIKAFKGKIYLVESSSTLEQKIECLPRNKFKIQLIEDGRCFENPKIFFDENDFTYIDRMTLITHNSSGSPINCKQSVISIGRDMLFHQSPNDNLTSHIYFFKVLR